MKKLVLSCLVAACAFAADVNLPAPFATPSARNPSKVVAPPAGAQLKVPAGFKVEEYMTGFVQPRFMTLGPNKELLIADTSGGTVYVAQDKNKKELLKGLSGPFGIAFWKDYIYVAETTSVKRYKYDPKALTAGAGEEVVSMKEASGGHSTRTITFDRKGEKLYVTVGSASNVNAGEPAIRAAVNRYNPDGTGHEIFVAGTRNPVGLDWQPGGDRLWITVQERDALGDDLVPDYFTHIEQGKFYGWPFAYIGPNEDPRRKGENPALVAKATVPDVLLPAHAGVLDLEFYTGKQFPKEYQGGAFIAFHGSWNRSKRHGYEIAFVPFKDGKPSGPWQDFMTGWMIAPDVTEVWGRPVGVLEMPDGSLLVSDDGGKKIWRISYGK